MSKQAILTTSFLALSLCANAQFNMLFTSDSELPNSLVNKVEEDKNGMIWVATEDGLCKYNGSRFITYRHNSANSNSLSHNFVRTICADSVGNVVVGTINGVQVYNIQTDDFTPRISAKEIGARMGNVNSILRLSDGVFFIEVPMPLPFTSTRKARYQQRGTLLRVRLMIYIVLPRLPTALYGYQDRLTALCSPTRTESFTM